MVEIVLYTIVEQTGKRKMLGYSSYQHHQLYHGSAPFIRRSSLCWLLPKIWFLFPRICCLLMAKGFAKRTGLQVSKKKGNVYSREIINLNQILRITYLWAILQLLQSESFWDKDTVAIMIKFVSERFMRLRWQRHKWIIQRSMHLTTIGTKTKPPFKNTV